jgi:hypothetical protein
MDWKYVYKLARLYEHCTLIISIYSTTACMYIVDILYDMSNEFCWYNNKIYNLINGFLTEQLKIQLNMWKFLPVIKHKIFIIQML